VPGNVPDRHLYRVTYMDDVRGHAVGITDEIYGVAYITCLGRVSHRHRPQALSLSYYVGHSLHLASIGLGARYHHHDQQPGHRQGSQDDPYDGPHGNPGRHQTDLRAEQISIVSHRLHLRTRVGLLPGRMPRYQTYVRFSGPIMPNRCSLVKTGEAGQASNICLDLSMIPSNFS